MELSIDRGAGLAVQAYETGKIRINGINYVRNLILMPEKVFPDWQPQNFTELTAADFKPLLDLQPDVILLGIGHKMAFPSHAIFADIYAARIGIEIMITAAACRTYNLLMSDGRKVVAALII